MTIKLMAIGKTDSRSLQTLIEKFENRLKFYVTFKLVILPDIKNTKHLNESQQKEKEGTLILNNLQPKDVVILLDEKGEALNSIAFANYLQKHMNAGIKQLVFVIGGPYGFSEAVYKKAHSKLALSKMTFSHQMIRLFFIEQLYRGFTILKNEPYHHK